MSIPLPAVYFLAAIGLIATVSVCLAVLLIWIFPDEVIEMEE